MSALDFLARRAARSAPVDGTPHDASHPESNRERRVLTHPEALALAEQAIAMVSVPIDAVKIRHRATAVAKIINRRLRGVDLDELVLNFGTRMGSNINVVIGTNVRDTATLQQVIRNAEMKKAPLIRKEDEDVDADDQGVWWQKPRSYLPVTLWHPETAAAMATARGETLAHMVQVMRSAETASQPLVMAGTVAVSALVQFTHYIGGRSGWGEATDSEVTVTARTPDGTASGWSGQAHRDWTKISPEQIAREAAAMANRSRGAVKVEPGRHTAILGPAAVGQLVAQMHTWFNASGNRGLTSPFGKFNSPDGRKLRLGERVFDERLTFVTDPNDPMGGDFPFFPDDATPTGMSMWIERGVLRALGYSPLDALEYGKTPMQEPYSLHMMPAPGTTTSTIEEMIASCNRGIYVHRFSGVQIADITSAALAGTTRDGCFLVKDGKIHSPVANFRFFESPFLVCNRIMAIGTPERVAFGYRPPRSWGEGDRHDQWPYAPIIVPPLMVRDFNFSSLSDAV